ncbi:MAG TPA: RNA 3'-terminal phosphate cyclase [Desulfobacteraceae bacterium]|nr:RNA 3'-terminal phosphate cyclase [Desulfobacteraceae bacterium]
MDDRIVIDGSIGEGGGQVLRTSLSLAALLGRPFEIHNIRLNRSRPGLRPQHLAAARALATVTGAELAGDRENSTSLLFAPQGVTGGNYRFSIGTAGSVTLLATALLPPLLFAPRPSSLVLEGGTHVPFSPVFHYLREIFLPFLRRMGAEVEADLDRWGWYPRGGGSCTIRVRPCRSLRALRVPRRGRLRDLTLTLGLAGLPLHIVDREEKRVRTCLGQKGYALAGRFEPAPSPGQGNVLFLRAEYEESLAGFSVLGKRGRRAEQVADELCRQWLRFEEGTGSVDKHLADQILLYMALAAGDSLLTAEEVTSHLSTNIQVIQQFLPVRFSIDPATLAVAVSGVARAPVESGAPQA